MGRKLAVVSSSVWRLLCVLTFAPEPVPRGYVWTQLCNLSIVLASLVVLLGHAPYRPFLLWIVVACVAGIVARPRGSAPLALLTAIAGAALVYEF